MQHGNIVQKQRWYCTQVISSAQTYAIKADQDERKAAQPPLGGTRWKQGFFQSRFKQLAWPRCEMKCLDMF